VTGAINKSAVDRLKPGAEPFVLWDRKLSGFGVKCNPNGTKVYVFQYKHLGRSRRYTIGKHGNPETAESARTTAEVLRGRAVAGQDPAAEKRAQRAAEALSEAVGRFKTEHLAKRQESTTRNYERDLDAAVAHLGGSRAVHEIARADVSRLHQSRAAAPFGANRQLAALSSFFTWAERQGLRPDGSNPCRHVERFPEPRRQRRLSEPELRRLGKALRALEPDEPWQAVAILRLLVLTGHRSAEFLALRRDELDLKSKTMMPGRTKTGAKVFPLAPAAVALLKGLPRSVSPWVFPRADGAHFTALRPTWERVRKAAKLRDVRIHTLRHTYASVAADSGESLPTIGALLGHTTPAMTARYAHLGPGEVRDAAGRVADRIDGALRGR